MQWWAWIAVGAVLLVLELTLIAADFYLVFLGIAALVIGILTLTGIVTAAWLQWLVFAALAAFSMVTFRRWVYERLRRKLPDMKSGPAGKTVVLPAASIAVAHGTHSMADHRPSPRADVRESIASTALP
jgi:membrane protein implicated in regulation of membrane protease activity